MCHWTTTAVFLLILLATACTPTQPALPTAAVAAILPTATATLPPATAEPLPATSTPISTATISPTVAPTATPPGCTTPGRVEMGSYPSTLAGESSYRIYLPPCYGENGRFYPTLYLLPGNIHSDAIWDTLGMDEAAEAAIRRGDLTPLLIVMADGGHLLNYTSGGSGSYESLILDDLIPFVEATYCAWGEPAGRAIGGLSRGGYWALEIAFRHPTHFASVGGHSAALLDTYAGPDLNPEYTGLSQNLGDLRIYFDIGEDDWSITPIRQLHEAMDAAHIPHTWVLNPGGHDDAYWSAHVADYLRWYAALWSFDEKAYPFCDQ